VKKKVNCPKDILSRWSQENLSAGVIVNCVEVDGLFPLASDCTFKDFRAISVIPKLPEMIRSLAAKIRILEERIDESNERLENHKKHPMPHPR